MCEWFALKQVRTCTNESAVKEHSGIYQMRKGTMTAADLYDCIVSGYMNKHINQALNEIQKKTCVRFKKVSSDYSGDHIRLVKGRG